MDFCSSEFIPLGKNGNYWIRSALMVRYGHHYIAASKTIANRPNTKRHTAQYKNGLELVSYNYHI